MKIELHKITIQKLTKGFADNDEQGVVAYGGKLDIRPPYQREFVYGDKERNAVIDSVRQNFPLNVMYWAVRDDGSYEVIDGQQRTLSICQYVADEFSLDWSGHQLSFNNLQDDQQKLILDYEVMVYFCTGSSSEKLNWFRTINIAGKEHTAQEIRNAVFAGPWTADAKRFFSKTGCVASKLGSDYISGSPIRQELLETVIDWIKDTKTIDEYMGLHKQDKNASPLWHYFQSVIGWVKATFPNYRKEMKGLDWGVFYNQFKGKTFDTDKLESQIATLMMDDDVTKKSGIYGYVLTGEEKRLNIRAFTPNQKREAYERQKGVCPKCKNRFPLSEMEADHIKPWREGGHTSADNCQMLCKADNRTKGAK